MTATARIPTSLRQLTDGSSEVEIPTGSVGTAIEDLTTRYPDLGERLLGDDGKPRRFVNIFVAEDDIRFLDGLDTAVNEGQVVTILPAVAGG
jgi:molybdopterin synthase sulfur carrier subunit